MSMKRKNFIFTYKLLLFCLTYLNYLISALHVLCLLLAIKAYYMYELKFQDIIMVNKKAHENFKTIGTSTQRDLRDEHIDQLTTLVKKLLGRNVRQEDQPPPALLRVKNNETKGEMFRKL